VGVIVAGSPLYLSFYYQSVDKAHELKSGKQDAVVPPTNRLYHWLSNFKIALHFRIHHDVEVPMAVLLSTKPGFLSFEEFLCSEWSVENLHFWNDVQDLKTEVAEIEEGSAEVSEDTRATFFLTARDSILTSINDIYQTYLGSGATSKINISASLQMEITEAIFACKISLRDNHLMEALQQGDEDSNKYCIQDPLAASALIASFLENLRSAVAIFHTAFIEVDQIMLECYRRYLNGRFYAALLAKHRPLLQSLAQRHSTLPRTPRTPRTPRASPTVEKA